MSIVKKGSEDMSENVMSWGNFADGIHAQTLEDAFEAGVKAWVELYYRDFTDATEIDGDTLHHMQRAVELVNNDVIFEDVVTEAEESINANGGIRSHSDGKLHKVGPTFKEEK